MSRPDKPMTEQEAKDIIWEARAALARLADRNRELWAERDRLTTLVEAVRIEASDIHRTSVNRIHRIRTLLEDR